VTLPREFYARPCLRVARALIGTWLVHDTGGKLKSGRIVETEAYIHEEDQACHARFGQTARNRIMYGEPGHAYVFLIYGMYDCFNVVTEPAGSPAAVLIRALESEDGRSDGPGKLTRTLGINRSHTGVDLTGNQLWLEDRGGKKPRIVATPRIGIDYASEWVDKPWRFVDANSPSLSRKLR
jgi:DNA-3-methyladenine glycosylase